MNFVLSLYLKEKSNENNTMTYFKRNVNETIFSRFGSV